MEQLCIHHVLPYSLANGPGARFALWVQGCTLGCPGCFNPETHPGDSGVSSPIRNLYEQIRDAAPLIEGITISGGEPLLQLLALGRLLALVKENTCLSVILFSGFSWSEIQRLPGYRAVIDNVDVLIAGRFRKDLRLAKNLIGSTNKTFHFLTPRYSQKDFEQLPPGEVVIQRDGQIVLSGIDPLIWSDRS